MGWGPGYALKETWKQQMKDEKPSQRRSTKDGSDDDSDKEYAYESDWYEVLKRRSEELEQEQPADDEAEA
jgi:hypothetical protein